MAILQIYFAHWIFLVFVTYSVLCLCLCQQYVKEALCNLVINPVVCLFSVRCFFTCPLTPISCNAVSLYLVVGFQ